MKLSSTLAGLIAFSFFLSCNTEQGPNADNLREKSKTLPDTGHTAAPDTALTLALKENPAGRKLFLENCEQCHGLDGKKQLDKAKDLSISRLTLEERIHIISSAQVIGNKVHQARWKTILSETEIAEIAGYLEFLRK